MEAAAASAVDDDVVEVGASAAELEIAIAVVVAATADEATATAELAVVEFVSCLWTRRGEKGGGRGEEGEAAIGGASERRVRAERTSTEEGSRSNRRRSMAKG